jgi:hypothetical protein
MQESLNRSKGNKGLAIGIERATLVSGRELNMDR